MSPFVLHLDPARRPDGTVPRHTSPQGSTPLRPSPTDPAALTWGDPARAEVILTPDALRLSVAPTSPAMLFVRAAPDHLAVSDTLSALAPDGPVPDPPPAALYALLQYGTVPPPLTLLPGVIRVVPGTCVTWHLPSMRSTVTPHRPLVGAPGVSDAGPDAAADLLRDALDAAVARDFGPSPLVLFSGGVDSSLIAARCAATGVMGARLLNFRTHESDREPEIAAAVAAALGLSLDQRFVPPGDLVAPALAEVFAAPQPFADVSSIPTTGLLTATPAGTGNAAIDGTGADGAFGMVGAAARWATARRRVAWTGPLPAWLYAAGLYARRGRLERLVRLAKRLNEKPPVAAALSQNALSGVLYRFDRNAIATADAAVEALPDAAAGGSVAPWAHRLILGDLVLVCASIFAQKTFAGLERRGHRAVYPYLAPEVLALALAWAHPPHPALVAEPKAPLKTLLVRQVPRGLVYRPKSGFVADLSQQFRLPGVLERLDAARSNPRLAPHLDARRVDVLLSHVRAGRWVGDQAYNCLWSLVIADQWLSTRPASRPATIPTST